MFNKIVLTIVLSTILSFLSACDWLETADRYYPNYESLSKSDEPGNWIPAFIPRSAVEIRERHKIDTGAEVLTFYFGNIGDLSLSGSCEKVTTEEVELPPPRFLNVAWWPDSLSRDRTKKEEIDQYEFYRCERQVYLAVRQVGGRFQAFYWGMR
jgi:hypothetical protein